MNIDPSEYSTMVLEATMILIDNSEFMRNGDYYPTRLEAAKDAIKLIFNSKRQSNVENAIGILSTADTPKVLTTFTNESGKINSELHNLQIYGKQSFVNSMAVAQIALKHRQNKNQHQRIVAFVGSPVNETEETLTKLAKKLKKNGVAVDIINIGEHSNVELLQGFINTVCGNENSHFVTSMAGNTLTDVISDSGILGDGDVHMGDGFDPDLDPELALALKMSLEEEQSRQAQAQTSAATSENQESHDVQMEERELTEEEMLQKAIEMSMQDSKKPE